MQQADVIETLQSELSAAIFDHNEQATLAALTNLSKQDVDVDILKVAHVGGFRAGLIESPVVEDRRWGYGRQAAEAQ